MVTVEVCGVGGSPGVGDGVGLTNCRVTVPGRELGGKVEGRSLCSLEVRKEVVCGGEKE